MVRCLLKKFPIKRSRNKINNKLLTPEHYRISIEPSFTKSLLEVVSSDLSVSEKCDHLITQLSKLRNNNNNTKFSKKTIKLLKERKNLISDKSKRKENHNTISKLSSKFVKI